MTIGGPVVRAAGGLFGNAGESFSVSPKVGKLVEQSSRFRCPWPFI